MASKSTIVIVGIGPWISLALGTKLASIGWSIALLSRSKAGLKKYAAAVQAASRDPAVKVCYHTADGRDPASLTAGLEWAKKELGHIDVLCYNAARCVPEDLMSLTPAILEDDFRAAAVGTLIAGQWFAQNADKSKIELKEWPMLLVTAGVLHLEPRTDYASLSAVKSASYNISMNLASVLPEKYQVKVGIPIVVDPIIPTSEGYATKSTPEAIVEELFMPFFAQRLRGDVPWTRDLIW